MLGSIAHLLVYSYSYSYPSSYCCLLTKIYLCACPHYYPYP